MRRGFTLAELLVVVAIVLLVSAAALPLLVPAVRERAVVAGSQSLQAALVGARDRATATGAAAGIRLLPDDAFPVSRLATGQLDPARAIAANRWVPIEVPRSYVSGRLSVYPSQVYPSVMRQGLPCLVVEEMPGEWILSGGAWLWIPVEPCEWWWTIRQGERLQIGDGRELVIVGPMAVSNPEGFVNAGQPGQASTWARTYTAPDGITTATGRPQYLLCVNGLDDDHDGFIDNGWDGVDNDGDGVTDAAAEWELETWPGKLAQGVTGGTYVIRRRPAPATGRPETMLPSAVVIDFTTWSTTGERSHGPMNPTTGTVDLLIGPDGLLVYDLPYGTPSSLGLSAAFVDLWIGDRSDVVDPRPAPAGTCTLPTPPEGDVRIVTVQLKTGRIAVLEPEGFDARDPGLPFRAAHRSGR